MTTAPLSLSQLRAIQKLGEAFFNVTVVIASKTAFGKDSVNPFGDETVSHSTGTTTVKGWLTTQPATSFTREGGGVSESGLYRLRVPVGTLIRPGDEVTTGGETYTVVDATNEASWPEWTVATLRRRVR
jgi:hypothetical protein